jgi:predicted GNAT family N-acyltransferase
VKEIFIKKVSNEDEFKKVLQIRTEVFIKEQNVPEEIELDGYDDQADHFIAFYENRPIGCARVRINKYAKLERIAILKNQRGKGFGKQLTNFLIEYCKNQDIQEIRMHSQVYVADFYKKIGFETVGNTFFEAGIEHVEMVLE